MSKWELTSEIGTRRRIEIISSHADFGTFECLENFIDKGELAMGDFASFSKSKNTAIQFLQALIRDNYFYLVWLKISL